MGKVCLAYATIGTCKGSCLRVLHVLGVKVHSCFKIGRVFCKLGWLGFGSVAMCETVAFLWSNQADLRSIRVFQEWGPNFNLTSDHPHRDLPYGAK